MPSIDADTIRQLISRFLSEEDSRTMWVRPAVEKHGFLPLRLGWVATIGVRPDGAFIRWNHDDGIDAIEPCSVAFLQRMALKQGSKVYPELAAFLPDRPPEAETCPKCEGTGSLLGTTHLICRCGGLGWMLPGEDRGLAP